MWKDILKRKGRGGKPSIGEWVKTFIRNHLESMSVGEKITTTEMIELLNKNIGEATFLSPKAGEGGSRPEMQVKFPSNTKFDNYLTKKNVSQILMRQNKDIVDIPREPAGRSKGYVVRK